jgi:hypothetical protein
MKKLVLVLFLFCSLLGFSQSTTIESYKVFDCDETVYTTGTIFATSGYEYINVYLEKTASTQDAIQLKASLFSSLTATLPYQQTSQSTSTGVTTVTGNVYQFAKEAGTYTFLIPTSGSKFMRIDAKKATDSGTASTVEMLISKVK